MPCGAVTAVILLFTLRPPIPPPRPRGSSWYHTSFLFLDKLDTQSTVLIIPSIVCLLLALQWGGTVYPWSDWRCILLLCIFSLTFCFWGYMQYRRGSRATVPPHIIRQRSIAAGSFYSAAAFGASMVMLYYLPIWFQAVRGASALESGIDLCPLMLSWAAFVIISAQIVSTLMIPRQSGYTDNCRLHVQAMLCHKCSCRVFLCRS